ncbi:MAG: HEAT repeat domain-containing protein [Aureliella sp.]
MRSFAPRGVQGDGSQPLSPTDSLGSFRPRNGVSVELVAAEPALSQPLYLSWDSRGRLWVVQYRQYQYPAGLKVVKFDNHLRAIFDKTPAPPPDHVHGRDKISVFEDTNGDGKYDSHRDVITGLNITSSLAIGDGGIWVLNPPYLLRYPDEDHDATPDGPPEVHLKGFGLQDTHSVANSLLWGPDGWLYGANGSTTVGNVSSRRTPATHFEGQCIWRYHPKTFEFEIYAEGGGNTFSLEIDSKGRVFAGTNGGNTRGWYFPQGSYSAKNWGKHGPLTNPYAFGFFGPMRFTGDGRRFPQAFAIYEGGLFNEPAFDGSIIAPNAMQNLVWQSNRIPDGSTYRTVDVDNILESSDRWFRPVYCGVGPDGAIYIADWYDTRLSHVSPTDDWHKSSGRVFRLRPSGSKPAYKLGDLHTAKDSHLIELLHHENKWVRRRAVLELGWREQLAPHILAELNMLAEQEQLLEALWVLNLQDKVSLEFAGKLLRSPNPDIRRWTVRILGDQHRSHSDLPALALREPDVQVRSQLAASARRLSATEGLAIVSNLLTHSEDATDLQLPLMLWWAVEEHCGDWPAVREFLSNEKLWNLELFRTAIATKIVQRYAATGTREDILRCAEILKLVESPSLSTSLAAGLYRAFQGRTMPPLPESLRVAIKRYRTEQGASELVLGIESGDAASRSAALEQLKSASAPVDTRIEIAEALGKYPFPAAAPALLQAATRRSGEPALQRVAIQSLAAYRAPSIAATLCRAMGSSISADYGLRPACCRTLASRRDWAIALLDEVIQWRLPASEIPADVVQRLRTFDDDEIRRKTDDAFGPAGKIESEEQREEIERLTTLIAKASGDPLQGKAIYVKNCGNCHQLFGQGAAIGPPLDNYDRRSLKFWLPAIVAPSIEIREGYQSYAALDTDGRVFTGMLAGEDLQVIKLRSSDGKTHTLERDELESFRAIPTSLMPSRILDNLSESEIRDLFAFLRSRL